jgi:molybdopterin synthase catalytic subunit
MHVRIQEADFDVGSELTALRRADPRIGALASFVGLVRDVRPAPARSASPSPACPAG